MTAFTDANLIQFMNQMIVVGCYSDIYQSSFSVAFQVLTLEGKSVSLCREDGVIVDNLPAGYLSLIAHGDCRRDQGREE